jgi:Cytosol aminopeptidase family, N-terminal domain
LDLRYTVPSLRQLDLLGSEILVAGLAEDERPPHGLAGLVDWRLAGRISALLRDGSVNGALGEVVLIPGKPKLPFDKVLLFGMGPIAAYTEVAFRAVLEKLLDTLQGLRARTAVVELPGRHCEAIAPERAVDILLQMAGPRAEHDAWTLVEPTEAQRAITQHMIQERRRIRHA